MTSLSSANNSLWVETANSAIQTDKIDTDRDCEIAIIGGGFTGLSAALHLAEAGKEVVLLEAKDFGEGGSGRNVGLVNAGLWTPPDDVEVALGPQAGQRLNHMLGNAPQLVFDLIDKHQINCEANRVGTLHLAHSMNGLKDIQNRTDQWAKRGAPVSLLGADDVAELTGSGSFLGGLLDERAGTINPMGYARGLADVAIKAGASLYSDSSVTSFIYNDGGWILKTETAKVSAKKVIMAVNAYGGNIAGELHYSFIPIKFSQFATEPLPDDIRRSILPQGHGTWDTSKIMRSFRMDTDGRLIIGTMGAMPRGDSNFLSNWAATTLQEIFPQIGTVKWESRWDGAIAYTPDHMPRLHMLGDSMIAAMGYNGRGIGPGTVFGKATADYILTGKSELLPIPFSHPKPVNFRSWKSCFYEAASQMEHRLGLISKLGM